LQNLLYAVGGNKHEDGFVVTENWIKYGFWLAGLANIGGVLVFSKGFTNAALTQGDPIVMSRFGLLMIIVWGLAYIAMAKTALQNRWIVAVFALEKLVYVVVWLLWIVSHYRGLAGLYSQDLLAGIFFSIYGLNDLAFMLFFILVFRQASQPGKG